MHHLNGLMSLPVAMLDKTSDQDVRLDQVHENERAHLQSHRHNRDGSELRNECSELLREFRDEQPNNDHQPAKKALKQGTFSSLRISVCTNTVNTFISLQLRLSSHDFNWGDQLFICVVSLFASNPSKAL